MFIILFCYLYFHIWKADLSDIPCLPVCYMAVIPDGYVATMYMWMMVDGGEYELNTGGYSIVRYRFNSILEDTEVVGFTVFSAYF